MTADRAESKLLICKETNENFLRSIITGKETKMYIYAPDTKQRSSQWNLPHFTVTEKMPAKYAAGPKWCSFFSYTVKSVVHYEYAPQIQTINQHFYLHILRQLCDAMHHEWLLKWEPGDKSFNNTSQH